MQLVVLPRWQVAEPHGVFLQDLAIFDGTGVARFVYACLTAGFT